MAVRSSRKRFIPRVLPVPPTINQRTAVLPDGSTDPAATTDCGEACLSAAVGVFSGIVLSPGCIRQALGRPQYDGRTTGPELVEALDAFGLRSRFFEPDAVGAWALCHELRKTGNLAIVLGRWEVFDALHWVLAYEGHQEFVWAMDPWNGRLTGISRLRFAEEYAGAVVHLH